MLTTNDENAARLADLSNRLLKTIWESNPVGATILGVHDYDSTIGDVSASGFERCCKDLRECIEALQTEVDASLLDADQETNRRASIALADSYVIMFGEQLGWRNNPSLYGSQAVWGCMSLLMRGPGSEHDRLRSVLRRTLEIPEMLSVSRNNIVDPAEVFVQIALGVNRGALAFFRDELPAIVAGSTLEREIRTAGDKAVSAFEDYDRWLRENVLPRSTGDFAVGSRVYERMLHGEHCLTCGTGDLVDLAHRELEEARERIAEVAASIDPSISWPELISRLKQDCPSREGLVEAYRVAVESARSFITERDLVTYPEDAELSVGITPEVERSIMPYAAYCPPAPFGSSKQGCLWITPIDETASEEQQRSQLSEHSIYSIPIIALHDGIPGHHLQLVRSMESAYPVRKQMLNSLFMEGWALYCEEMMYEHGFYSDPRVQFFQLKDMIWRACRVIIDVGLHTGGMNMDEAAAMLVDEACIEEATAAAEVRRYVMSPTQPMTYVVGKLMLLDLRERMQRKLGGRFDLKGFHDELLSFGSIPPALIIDRMLGEEQDIDSALPILRSA